MDVIKTLSLKGGRTTYIDLIEPLEEGIAEVLIADEDGILLHVQEATYAVALFNPAAAVTFADALSQSKDPISVHTGPLVPMLNGKGLTVSLECIQAVYPSTQPLTEDESILIRLLRRGTLLWCCITTNMVMKHIFVNDFSQGGL